MFSEKYVNGNADKTGNEYSVVAEPPDGVSKLFFVCSKKAANEYDSDDDEGCGVDRRSDRSRKSEKIKRASNNKLSFKNNLNNNNVNVEKTVNSDKLTSFKEVYATSEEPGQEDDKSCIKPADAALKATYSEPSLCKGDTGLSRRHRHRRRRERNRSQRFGYEIKNVDDFLSKVYMLWRESNTETFNSLSVKFTSEYNFDSIVYSVRFHPREIFPSSYRHPAPYTKLDQAAIKLKYHYR